MRTAWEEAEIAIEEARLAILVNRWDNDHDHNHDHDYDDHNHGDDDRDREHDHDHDDHDLEQKEIKFFFCWAIMEQMCEWGLEKGAGRTEEEVSSF